MDEPKVLWCKKPVLKRGWSDQVGEVNGDDRGGVEGFEICNLA